MFNNQFNTPITSLNYTDGKNSYFIKRDDLIPFSFGGNKVRIALRYFKDMESKGKDCIISYGSSQSNLNRVIANLSRCKNIPCYIIVPVEEGNAIDRQHSNSKLLHLYDAKIFNCNRENVSKTVDLVIKSAKNEGLNPYYVFGDSFGNGNEKTPVEAYVEAYKEIKEYEEYNKINFDYIFLASGTGMTQAGLICGKLQFNDKRKIVGISVARKKEVGERVISNYINQYHHIEEDTAMTNSIHFEDELVKGGYGEHNDQVFEVIKQLLAYDGIPLDPTYTAKGFSGMQKYIKENKLKGKNILFLHTGGLPIFFDNLSKI